MTIRRAFLAVALVFSISSFASASRAATAEPRNPATAQPVDILITGGIVMPMTGEDIENGAVAIRNGSIVAVGRASVVGAKYKAKTTIDAHGMAVLPGFVNTHTHVAMSLFRGIADDRDLMDWLQNYIFPAEAKNVDREFVKWGTRLGEIEMIRSGTTTLADMYYFESEVAKQTKAAGLRGVLGETLIDFPAPDNKTWEAMVANVRSFVHEWKGDRLITPALAPHAPYTVSEDHLKQVRALATELGAPILIHVSETKNELQQIAEKHNGMTPGMYLDSIGFLGHDVVAAHGVWLTPEEITIFAAKGTGVAHNPDSNMMLASGVAPIPAMLRAGVNVGLGTDGPAGSGNNMDMIEVMANAARLQKVASLDPKILGAREVLKMATIGGAKVLGLDDKIGTLEAGKRADVIVIDLRHAKTQPVYSVESAVVYAATGDDVVDTICDGRILMRDKKVLTIDVAPTLAKAKEYRDKVRASLKKPAAKQ